MAMEVPFMKKIRWTPFELHVACLTAAIIPLAAWLSAQLLQPLGTAVCLSAVFFVSTVCTAALIRLLKGRGKRVWPAGAVLLALILLLCAGLGNLRVPVQLFARLTGQYAPESVAFALLFLLLLCDGALAGIGIGTGVCAMQKRGRRSAGASRSKKRAI